MINDISILVRENIRSLQPYSTARHEHQGPASVFLDANENPFGSPVKDDYTRYPDPLQKQLKEKISLVKGVPPENIFLGNGSDEAIDLLIRIFCEPGVDNIIIMTPTYGMYSVCAAINNILVKNVPLTEDFQPDIETLESSIDARTKIIFICSPNNPTGNSINRQEIEIILSNFQGIVVIDEAYINFARQKTFITELTEFPHLVILQTFSKAWGLAGVRMGMAFAGSPVIKLLNKIKYPYNVSTSSQNIVNDALENVRQVNDWITELVSERNNLSVELKEFSFVQTVYPSDANFVLVKMKNPGDVFTFLAAKGIIVRDRSAVPGCAGCLRITIGSKQENQKLLIALKEYSV